MTNVFPPIDVLKVDFTTVTNYLRRVQTSTVHGLAWANIYVTTDGRACAVLQSGATIKTYHVNPGALVVEFFDDCYETRRDGTFTGERIELTAMRYVVDVDALAERGGAQREAFKARGSINEAAQLKNGGVERLRKQRAVPLPVPSRVRSL